MKIKRKLLLILCFCMILPLLVACGDNTKDNNDTPVFIFATRDAKTVVASLFAYRKSMIDYSAEVASGDACV